MNFPSDQELFRNIPVRGTSYSTTNADVESICAVYDRCYEMVAGETLAEHKGFIKSAPKSDQRAVIHKDFERIAHKLDQALEKHLTATDGYIGRFPNAKQPYATVAQTDHYEFDHFHWCAFDRNSLVFPLSRLDALVDQERFRLNVFKNAFALSAAVVCIVLLWLFQGWFFVPYARFGLLRIAALTLMFVGLLALIWWSSHDPEEFASEFGFDESPAAFLGTGLVAAVLVRLFLSGTTATTVCCVLAGMSGLCFLVRLLTAHSCLRQVQSRSPTLQKRSLEDRNRFEQNAQRNYRLVRFYELWYEYESTEENKQHMQYIRRSLMECIEQYDEWCCKYLDTDE